MNTPDFRNYKNAEIDKTIDAAMTSLRTITGNSMDLNIMNVKICSVSCALVSIEGMISTSAMSELIFRPIMELSARKSKGNAEQVFDFLTKESLLAAVSKKIEYYDDEELDRFRGRPSNGYNEEEVEEFREIMYTCKEHEIRVAVDVERVEVGASAVV